MEIFQFVCMGVVLTFQDYMSLAFMVNWMKQVIPFEPEFLCAITLSLVVLIFLVLLLKTLGLECKAKVL